MSVGAIAFFATLTEPARLCGLQLQHAFLFSLPLPLFDDVLWDRTEARREPVWHSII